MPAIRDFTGERFHKLLVLKMTGERIAGSVVWVCRCDCGTIKKVSSQSLRSGHSQSCGCYNGAPKHGHAGTKDRGRKSPTYLSWRAMKQRCADESNLDYGGRGIKVCKRWLVFENFLADMGERPEGKTLDRIDPNGNYTPKNCRWQSLLHQNNNRRRCMGLLEFNGESLPATSWAKRYGLTEKSIYRRIKKGWTVEEAITTPP